MVNLMAFLSSFASYLLVFFVFIAVIVTGGAIGITVRKAVDNKKSKNKDNNQE